MRRDKLVELLSKRRNNEVVVKVSDTTLIMPITNVRYSPLADQIFLYVEGSDSLDVINDIIGIFREFDKLASEYGIGYLPKYKEIKDRLAEAIGCTVDFISNKEDSK